MEDLWHEEVKRNTLLRKSGKPMTSTPGDGMIIGRRGKKVAAFRDAKGNIHRLCSRFKPSGEAMAGPAEESLSPI